MPLKVISFVSAFISLLATTVQNGQEKRVQERYLWGHHPNSRPQSSSKGTVSSPVHFLVFSIRWSCKNLSCLCYLNKKNTYIQLFLSSGYKHMICMVHTHTLCWNTATYWDCVCMIFKQSKRNLAIASCIRTLRSALKKKRKINTSDLASCSHSHASLCCKPG